MKSYKEVNFIPATQKGYPMFFLNKCKIYTLNGRVVYSNIQNDTEYSFNIPYLNTAIIVMGYGTSITNKAITILAENKVLLFVVSNNFNLHAILQPDNDLSLNKYAIYLSKTIEQNRLEIAKKMLLKRFELNKKFSELLNIPHFKIIEKKITTDTDKILKATSIEELLGYEGNYVKNFKNEFSKILKKQNQDLSTHFKIINNICYGAASIVLNSYSIPYWLNIFHGRTNNGALKYDIADLIKGLAILLAYTQDTSKIKTEEELFKFYSDIIFYDLKTLNILFEETKEVLGLEHA